MTKETPLTALYAGSFDPPTYGHLDIIQRAAVIFPNLIVAIGVSADKKPFLSVEDRMELLKDLCKDLNNVTISSYTGLTVKFAKDQNASVLVRGARNHIDWNYEVTGATMNRELVKTIETVIIPSLPSKSHISSSLIREIASHQGDISSLTSALVCQKVTDKFT